MSNVITNKVTAFALGLAAIGASTALTLTATTATTVAFSAITATSAQAKECKTAITKTVSPKLQTRGGRNRALRRAKRQWRKDVKINFGSKFANFKKARNKSETCKLTRNKVFCTVTATPCG